MACNGIGGTLKRKEIVALVQEKAKWWVKWLGLGYWDITFQFGEDKPEGRYSDEYLVGLSEPIGSTRQRLSPSIQRA
jgi:hypothetical protein